jgi:hypothetical protein
MSYQPFRTGYAFRNGVVWGGLTYLAGLALTVVVIVGELHPDRGIWTYQIGGNPIEYVAFHGYLHLPAGQSGLEGELLVYRLLMVYLLVSAGFMLSRRTTDTQWSGGFKTGASLLTGFLPFVLVASALIGVTYDPLTPSDLFTPLFIVGVVYPTVFGGVGGLLAELA